MNAKSFKFFKNKWIAIPTILGLVYFIYWLINKVNSITSPVLECEGQQKTYPNQWYENKAEALKIAFGHSYDSTDETTVVNIFNQLHNCDDFNALNVAFGVQQYASVIPFVYYDYTLEGHIQEELSTGYKEQLNEILTSIGVTYQY